MLSVNRPNFVKTRFDEVAIADFGTFQVAVPTVAKPVKWAFSTQQLERPQREYSRTGWIVCGDRLLGTVAELKLGKAAAADSIFKPIQRLGPAIPVAFEVRSHRSLPGVVSQSAQFSCRWNDAQTPYCTVFRNISPRFTRVYAVSNWRQFRVVDQVRQFLADEAQFIHQHRAQLQQVPFYQERFGL